MLKTRLRIRFAKSGDLRWISHLDLARVWERLLRRSMLRLAFSEGFHPKPKISFPSALALGIEALEEVVELELEGVFDLADVEQCIRAQMVDGMSLLAIEARPPGSAKAQVVASRFRVPLPSECQLRVQDRIRCILEQPALSIDRDGKTVVVDTRDRWLNFQLLDDYLYFTLPSTQQGAMRPSELLECLGIGELVEQGALLQRVELFLENSADGRPAVEALCAGPMSDVTMLPE